MRRFSLLVAVGLTFFVFISAVSQTTTIIDKTPVINTRNANALKNELLQDLQSLEAEAKKIELPLQRAYAQAEIADAMWWLDQASAQNVLRSAFELTLPNEDERKKLRSKAAGSAPTIPTDDDLVKGTVRSRIISIARRDKAFADELVKLSEEQLGSLEGAASYASLAAKSIQSGDTKKASDYILQAFDSDPTQIAAGLTILDLAIHDRAAADTLIIQYIERLRSVPLSQTNGSALRTYFVLRNIVFPSQIPNQMRPKPVPPTGHAAIKSYLNFVVESMSNLEQREPGSVRFLRDFLLATWLPINQYVPELIPSFVTIEALSRKTGEDASLPQVSKDEASKTARQESAKSALESRDQQEIVQAINYALGQGEYDEARKLINALDSDNQKQNFIEEANFGEASSLIAKGNTLAAEQIAARLTKPMSILQVYPALISKCLSAKNPSCDTSLVYQAIKKLKVSEDVELVPLALTKLALAVTRTSGETAAIVLDEAVQAANTTAKLDTRQAFAGIDTTAFKALATKHEERSRAAASALTNRLQRIIALAAIYQWKSENLSRDGKADLKSVSANKPKKLAETP